MADAVVIDGSNAEAVSREGARASIELPALLSHLTSPPAMDTLDLVLPDGMKAVRSRKGVTILVHETPPAAWNLTWIAPDSRTKFGPGTKYRKVRIALPYLITFCVFEHVAPNRPQLTAKNECFFHREPLHKLDEGKLCFPALLNCSKFPQEQHRPLAWICTEHLDFEAINEIDDANERVRALFRALMETLFGSGFNFSSEAHEGSSWFTETIKKRVDPRVTSVERWEIETEKDPMFALDVPWLSTKRTVAQMLDRIFGLAGTATSGETDVKTSDDIARIIFNHA